MTNFDFNDLSLPLDKGFILKRTSEEEIFEHYLNVEVQTEHHFKNPLRDDRNPTCTFAYIGGRLLFRDWAWMKPLDCFALVQKIYNCSFGQALHHIASDMGLEGKETQKQYELKFEQMKKEKNKKDKEKSVIQVKRGKWRKKEIKYLKSHGISASTCNKFNVYPVKHVWLNGKTNYIYKKSDPAFGYYFGLDDNGNQKWKIYFYERDGQFRFLCNTNRINGWVQIPDEGENLVITKSMKDVMALYEFDVTSIAMQNETTIPYDYIMEELWSRYTNIYSLYDFDLAGVRTANILRNKYGVKPLFLTDGRFGTEDYGAKDFSDYVKYKGRKTARMLVNITRRELINKTRNNYV